MKDNFKVGMYRNSTEIEDYTNKSIFELTQSNHLKECDIRGTIMYKIIKPLVFKSERKKKIKNRYKIR